MSLRVWLPLNGDLENKGLQDIGDPVNNRFVYDNNGKIGKAATGSVGWHLNEDFLENQWSVATWIKATTPFSPSNNIIFCKNISQFTDCHIYFSIINGTELVIGVNGPSNDLSYNYNFDLNMWYHVAATYDGNKAILYINGQQKISKIITREYSQGKLNIRINGRSANDSNTSVTGELSGYYFNDFRIYDNALSLKQIKEISKGLILHYKLDDPYIEPTLNYLGSKGETFVNIWGSYGFGSKGQITLATNQQSVCGGEVALVTNKTTETNATKTEMATCFTEIQSTVMNTNDTFTISAYVKGTSQTIGKTCFVHLYNSNGTDTKSNGTSYVLTDQWQRITHTMTWTATNPSFNSGNCYVAAIIKGGESFYVCNVQVEKLNHATPYTSLSRTDCFISDSSGYQNNGTIVGNIQLINNSPRYAAAASFNGTSAINCVSLTPEAKTISLWVKWDVIPSHQSVVFLDYKSKLGLGLMSTGILCGTSGSSNYKTFSKTGLIANTWYHFVVINPGKATGTDRKLYINGIEQEKTSNLSYWDYNIDQIQIGKRSTTSDGLIGKISDVRLYATVLSADDIKELYQTSALIDRNQNLYVRELVEI